MLERMINELSFAKFQKDLKLAFKGYKYKICISNGLYNTNELSGKDEELIFIQTKLITVFDYEKNKEINAIYIQQIWLNTKLLYKINNDGNTVAERIKDYINNNIEKIYRNNNKEINKEIFTLISK